MIKLEDIKTLAEAKDFLRAHYEKGVKCPCCAQHTQLYKRKLHAEMAKCLIAFYFIVDRTPRWVHIPTEFTARRINYMNAEFIKLQYWGMIEEKPLDPEEKKDTGFWRLTKIGLDFVEDRIRVKRFVYLYNRQVVRGRTDKDPETTNIRESLGDKFNYDDLMNADPKPTAST